MNSTITFSDYFYSKYYCGRSTTSADAKGEAMAHAAGHNHRHKGPARFCSLDFGECNGYLKGPTWFHSLDFGERNRYLKDLARFCSLDFGEHNGYLKGPTRFCSLDSSERNGYLKGIAPIDAQQKNMELRAFSCSRGSS